MGQRRVLSLESLAVATAEQLADVFARVNRELIELVERVSSEAWRITAANAPGWELGEDERRTVGQVALHTANQHLVQLAIVLGVANGEVAQVRNPSNEEEARQNPDPDRGEVLRRLRENGEIVYAALAALSAEQLDRAVTFKSWTMTCRETVEQLAIGHVRWHLASIRTTVGDS
jgi:hypothetical protein